MLNSCDLEDTIALDRSRLTLTTAWTRDCTDAEDKAQLIDLLQRSERQFDILRRLLEEKYAESRARQEDFNRADIKGNIVAETGYQKALRDVYRLLPRPRRTT